jgi:hypothetical protein
MAVPDQLNWKEEFDESNKLDIIYNSPIIKKWYEQSDKSIDNPYQLVELNDRMKELFMFIKGQLKYNNLDETQIIKVIDKLKKFYKEQNDKTKKSDIIFIDLLIESNRLANEINPDQHFNYNIDLDKDLRKFMPQVVEHFKPSQLLQLNFKDFLNKDFLTEFKNIVTIDVVENLDKASIEEQEKGGLLYKFQYESHMEYLYIQLIIKMLETDYIENLNPISNWLENYPFRMLNKNGLSTPDNFYMSAYNYINTELDNRNIKNLYLGFFNKLKNVRSYPAVYIESPIDFLDLYDVASQVVDTSINMRSIYFREDFDYLNSLNIKGVNLNRKFWIMIDAELDNKKLGFYIKSVGTVSNIEEFLNIITTNLATVTNDFMEKLKYEVYKQQELCKAQPEEEEEPIAYGDVVLSNKEYELLYNNGAKPIYMRMKTYNQSTQQIEITGSDSKATKVLSIPGTNKTRVINIVSSEDINLDNPENEPVLYKKLNYKVSLDVDENLIKDKLYEAIFFHPFGFEERKIRRFLQLEEKSTNNNEVDLNSMSNSDASSFNINMLGGGLQTPREKFFHSIIFMKISKLEQQYTEIEFDINNMSKQNLLDFIKKMVNVHQITYYKLLFSLSEKYEKMQTSVYNTSDHELIMSEISSREALLTLEMSNLYSKLDETRRNAYDKLQKQKNEEEIAIYERGELDKERYIELQELENQIEADYEEAKIEAETRISEAQIYLDEALEKEKLTKEKLESTIVAKNSESEKLMEQAKEKAEQLEEKIKSEMASKKENDKKVSTFKGQLTKLMTKIKKDIMDKLEIVIIEDKLKLDKLTALHKNDKTNKANKANKANKTTNKNSKSRVQIVQEAISTKENLKQKLAKFIKYEFEDDTGIKFYYSTYKKALDEYNQPYIIKTRYSDRPNVVKEDDTFEKLEKAYDKFKKELERQNDLLNTEALALKPVEYLPEETENSSTTKRSTRLSAKAARCKKEFKENVKGWCYKSKKSDEKESEESIEESKKGKLLEEKEIDKNSVDLVPSPTNAETVVQTNTQSDSDL